MSHYFTNDAQLKENRREMSFRFLGMNYTVMSDDGVFSKDGLDEGTESLLAVVINENISGTLCDLGAGLGVVGIVLSSHFDIDVTGIEVNERACALANDNYKKYKVKGRVLLQDHVSGTYDWVISNPPIRVGKAILYRLIEEAYISLHEGGSFMFVIRKQHGAKSAQAHCVNLFGNCVLLKKTKGYYIYKATKLTI